jgi:hypothetical protein
LPSTFVINDSPDFRERTAAPVAAAAAAWCVMCDEMMAEPSAVFVLSGLFAFLWDARA